MGDPEAYDPHAAVDKWLAVWERRLAGTSARPGLVRVAPALRTRVHRLIHEITELMAATRLNVAVARTMELTTALRGHPDRADPAVREGAEALVRMIPAVAPFTAEEAWERLGRPPSVIEHGWPEADPDLLVEET